MTTEQFLNRMAELYAENVAISKAKNADYAGTSDPFKNFRLCESIGVVTAEQGLLVRMTDKLSRISNLLSKDGEVKDESIADTLSDLANYSMILRMYIEEKHEQ